MYQRPVYNTLVDRLKEPRKFLQVLAGPRQTGKTTLIHQAMDKLNIPKHYASADEPTLQSRAWIGQLQDAGNTTTLAHYLELLSSAGMLTGLHKFAGQRIRQRASSPKLQVLNTALLSSQSNLSFNAAQRVLG